GLVGASPDHEGKRSKTATIERRNDRTIGFNNAKLLPELPDGEGLALDDLHLDTGGIDLAHFSALDPGKLGYALAGILHIKSHHRGPAIETNLLQDVDLRGLDVARDVDILDGKSGAGRHSLNDRLGVPTLYAAINEDKTEQR